MEISEEIINIKEEYSSGDNICRLCLEKNKSCTNIFDILQDLSARLHLLFQLRISKNDNWPQNICIDCLEKVESYHAFYNTVKESEIKLEQLFGVLIESDNKKIIEEILVVPELKFNFENEANELAKAINVAENYIQKYNNKNDRKLQLQVRSDISDNDDNDDSYDNDDDDDDYNLEKNKKSQNIQKNRLPKRRIHNDHECKTCDEIFSSKKALKSHSNRHMDSNSMIDIKVENSYAADLSSEKSENPEAEDSKFENDSDDVLSDEDWALDENVSKAKKKNKKSTKPNNSSPSKDTTSKEKKLTDEEKMKLDSKREQEELNMKKFCKMECALCPKKFDKFWDAKPHYEEEHGENRGYIVCCGKKYEKRFKLVQHLAIHVNPDAYACNICKKRFKSPYAIRDHMESHEPPENRRFSCDKCPMRFTKMSRLKVHFSVHLPDEEKAFICPQCDKPFAKKSILTAHIRFKHEAAGTHVCEICARVFKTKESFVRHQTEHMEKRPPKVECQLCGMKYKHKDGLARHLLRHKNANVTHKCHVCGQISATKRALAAHIKYVHSEKQFKCTLCDKAFGRPIYLKEHLAAHTGELLYKCSYCPKMFNSNANKYVHQKRKHPIEWEESIKRKNAD